MTEVTPEKVEKIRFNAATRIDPALIHVKEGFNCRDFDTPDAKESDEVLYNSIIANGVKQPLTVFQDDDGTIWLTDGERRLRAVLKAIEAGADLKTVPVQLEPRHSSEEDHYLTQIIRNEGRPFTPAEKAKVFAKLRDYGWEIAKIAEKSGLTGTYVTNLLTLASAPSSIQDLVARNKISATLATETIQSLGKGKAAKALKAAVAVAEEAGKSSATAKHIPKEYLVDAKGKLGKAKAKSKKVEADDEDEGETKEAVKTTASEGAAEPKARATKADAGAAHTLEKVKILFEQGAQREGSDDLTPIWFTDDELRKLRVYFKIEGGAVVEEDDAE